MLQHILIAVRILKRYILKGNVPVERLPVFLLRLEGIAILLNNFRCVPHIRLGLHQSGETLHIDLNRDQIGNRPDNPLHRLHHAQRIGHEYRQSADLDHPLQRNNAAPPQHQCQSQGG